MGELFDADEAFGDDYLFFARASLDDERSDDDLAVIAERVRLGGTTRVLDAPCGHGRLAVRLAATGCLVTGLDRSASYLGHARDAAAARGVSATFVEGDLRRLPLDGPFDLVVCWFTSFGYFDDQENLEVLREFRRVLAPGGTLLVETLSHDGFVRAFTESPEAVVTDVDGELMVDRNDFDVTTGRVRTRRVVVRGGSRRETSHAIRLLTVPEWHRWLGDAGFGDVEVTDRAGAPPELSSWRLVVRAVAR